MHSLRFALILAITALAIALIGFLIIGLTGFISVFTIILIGYVFLYFQATHFIIASTLATNATEQKYEQLHQTVKEIATHLKVATPKIFISPSPQPNALLVGHENNPTILITRGLLEMKHEDEAIALITLAIAYTKQDLFFHTYVIAFTSLFTKVAQLGQFSILRPVKRREKGNSFGALLFFILAPFAAFCIKFVTDPERHYKADFIAASSIRKPEILAKSLEYVDGRVEDDIPLINPNPATAALYVVHPFSHKTLSSFFDTHPPLETRLLKLHNMLI